MAMSQEPKNNAAVLDAVREAIEHAAAGKVFGAPVEHDGITVLPVAKVSGGGGRGGGAVAWRPALDVNKVIIGAQIVAVGTARGPGDRQRARRPSAYPSRAAGQIIDVVRPLVVPGHHHHRTGRATDQVVAHRAVHEAGLPLAA
jgi:hypothetical protein